MRAMMVDERHPALGKTRPQSQVQPAFLRRGNGPDHRHAVHLFRPHPRQLQAHGDGFFGKTARLRAPPAHQLRLFHRGHQPPVNQNGACRVVQDAANSQNDHRFCCCAFSIFAHASRSATVRLNTSFSAVESLSTQK